MLKVLWPEATRDPRLAGLIDEYAKRIRHYAPFRIDEVRLSRSERAGPVVDREGDRILGRIPDGAPLVLLDAGGKQMSSTALARWLEGRLSTSTGDLHMVVGGHDGLSGALRARATEMLSLSPLTLTHEMARVLLLEQLYRAFTILRGERYHH